ncbi:DUF2213 domain-containing protein [Candidatus Kirkpatrickella diaphorinae]|uniref:DUF2213 domain-containing protein n=1 Tax=Candidatus Kirkpatrickella diaphorinae TaxID=2984322 RepID=A0ABY6GHP5_9PROT|nr:DUF2213 domain-containing protein [Candidatus Kirkpatrickella diaphorinae]UYH50829.1 DUF2213 domain-containing protein [Candidatus Kirkpatrickella diaphorinae]
MELTHPGPCKDPQWLDDPPSSPPAPFQTVMALDETVRHIDADGHLHITTCVLSAAGISPYWGREIPDHARLGLKPDRIYPVYRPADVLERAASSFNGKPILLSHLPVTASQHPRGITVGAVGKAVFDGEAVSADLTFWDNAAIDSIAAGVRRGVSAGYSYRVVAEAGTCEGQEYGLKMDDIRFNHLALVETPRVPRAVIGDQAPLLESPERDARSQDAAPSAGKQDAGRKPEASPDREDDPEPAQEGAALQSFAQTLSDALRHGTLSDETPFDAIEAWLRRIVSDEIQSVIPAQRHEKPTVDVSDVEEGAAPEPSASGDAGVKEDAAQAALTPHETAIAALDEAIRQERLRNQRAEAARQAVRPLVGEVMGLDDAEDIYRYALEQIDLPAASIHPSALPAVVALVNRFSSRIGLMPHPSLIGGRADDGPIWAASSPSELVDMPSPRGAAGMHGSAMMQASAHSVFSNCDPKAASVPPPNRAAHSILSGIAVPKKL